MCISVPTRKRGGSGKARRLQPGDKMTSRRPCLPGRGPNEERFIDKVHTTPEEPGREPPGFDTMVRGAKAQAHIGRQGLCQQGQPGRPARSRHRDGIMRTAARHRPLRACEKHGGRLSSKQPLAGLCNAYATMKRRPIVRADQNKTSSWRWRQSGRTCPANTGYRITGPPKPLCPM